MSGDGPVTLGRLVEFARAGNLPAHRNEILDLEAIGDMATAKVRSNLPDREFVDILTLFKLNVAWEIVSKTYTTILKQQAQSQRGNTAATTLSNSGPEAKPKERMRLTLKTG